MTYHRCQLCLKKTALYKLTICGCCKRSVCSACYSPTETICHSCVAKQAELKQKVLQLYRDEITNLAVPIKREADKFKVAFVHTDILFFLLKNGLAVVS